MSGRGSSSAEAALDERFDVDRVGHASLGRRVGLDPRQALRVDERRELRDEDVVLGASAHGRAHHDRPAAAD